MVTTETLIIEIISITLSTTFVVLSVWANVRNMSRNQEMFMQKRHPGSVYTLNAALLFIIISLQSTISLSIHTNSSLVLIPLTFMFISIWSFFCVILTRSFMLFFKINWTRATLRDDTQQWQYFLTPSADIKSEPNWFIINHRRFGRTKKMYKIFGVWCSTGCILCVVASILVMKMEYSIDLYIVISATVTPVILSYSILVYKCPSFEDQFQIHWEQSVHSKLLVLMAITMIFTVLCRILFPSSAIWLVFIPICSSLWFAMSWVSSYVIYTKNKRESLLRARNRRRTVSEVSRSASGPPSSCNITVEAIMSNETAICLFIQHLMREYSVEVMLAYIEFSQFQEYLSDAMPLATIIKMKTCDFPSCIPTSDIIKSDDGAKLKAHLLYMKYIASQSEYEINIASSERNRLFEIFEDLDHLLSEENTITDEELFFMFEPCKKAMIQLLQYSLSRMKLHPSYGRMAQIFDDSGGLDTVNVD